MKKFFVVYVVFLVFVLPVYGGGNKEKKPEDVRTSSKRHITIINKTESRIKGYTVSTASGVLVLRGKKDDDSFSIEIRDGFKNDSEFEVALVDVYDKIYVKNFNVAKKGNTDAPISASDRKSEGFLKDRWKDIIKWFNENK